MLGVELDSRYQVEAYELIKKSISDTGKAGIVLPTGTGKTYLALKLIEDNLDKKQILYVSPSPTINARVRKIIRSTYDKEKAKEILAKIKFITYHGLNKRYKNHKEDMREYDSGIIILDEVHRSGAEEWGKAVDYLLENNKNARIIRNDSYAIKDRWSKYDRKKVWPNSLRIKAIRCSSKRNTKITNIYNIKIYI